MIGLYPYSAQIQFTALITFIQTRKHSSRMRTARFYGCRGYAPGGGGMVLGVWSLGGMVGRHYAPPPDRMTHTCENNTFPQLDGGKYSAQTKNKVTTLWEWQNSRILPRFCSKFPSIILDFQVTSMLFWIKICKKSNTCGPPIFPVFTPFSRLLLKNIKF